MKIYVLGLVSMLVLTCSALNCQTFPSPESSPEWFLSGLPGSDLISEELWIDSVGVEVDGVVWHSITAVREYNPVNGWPPDTTSIGFYRTSNSKTYFRNVFDDEGLLYDFSVEIGDTLELMSPGGFANVTTSYRVTEVDFVTCNSATKKRITLEFDQFGRTYVSTWIEGVGDVYHPFPPGTCSSITCSIIYVGGELKVDGLSLLLEGELTCNTLSNSLSQSLNVGVKVVPNPIGNGFNLSFDEEDFGGNLSIRLLNAFGALVLEDEVTSSEYIDVGNLEGGVYFLIVLSERGNRSVVRVLKN